MSMPKELWVAEKWPHAFTEDLQVKEHTRYILPPEHIEGLGEDLEKYALCEAWPIEFCDKILKAATAYAEIMDKK